jgi:hypothetical protein
VLLKAEFNDRRKLHQTLKDHENLRTFGVPSEIGKTFIQIERKLDNS